MTQTRLCRSRFTDIRCTAQRRCERTEKRDARQCYPHAQIRMAYTCLFLSDGTRSGSLSGICCLAAFTVSYAARLLGLTHIALSDRTLFRLLRKLCLGLLGQDPDELRARGLSPPLMLPCPTSPFLFTLFATVNQWRILLCVSRSGTRLIEKFFYLSLSVS